MRLLGNIAVILGAAALTACGGAPVPPGPQTTTFANPMAIVVPAAGRTSGPAAPYPGAITVAAMPRNLLRVTVTLSGLAHGFPDDLDVLLVGPGGETALLMSDAGGGDAVANLTLTFDDAAADVLPDEGALTSGTFRPTDHVGTHDDFVAPAPSGPHGTALDVFDGTDPNGAWRLFVVDDVPGIGGTIAGGWSLTISGD